jgi:hydroxyacylglutathione hydrolase
MEPSARAQFASIQREFTSLPPYIQVWPAHGAGSACGKALGDVPISTVGYELRNNRSIEAAVDEQTFVTFILAGQPEPPLYFARMKRDNRSGPAPLKALPAPVPLSVQSIDGLQHRRDVVVLDTRPRGAYFAGHLGGSILAELDYQFCSIAGSYVDEGVPLHLVVDADRVEEAVRALIRVGLDHIVGYLTPATLDAHVAAGGQLVTTTTIDMREMESRRAAGEPIVDVRGAAEFEAGHVPGAINVPHTRLGVQLDALPKGAAILVHCNSGARSAAAVSLLERQGIPAIQVNDFFANYRPASHVAGATT